MIDFYKPRVTAAGFTTSADANIAALNDIHDRARELERKNQLLRAKYANDAKYARIHKRLLEKGEPTPDERKLFAGGDAETDIIDNSIRAKAHHQIFNPQQAHDFLRTSSALRKASPITSLIASPPCFSPACP